MINILNVVYFHHLFLQIIHLKTIVKTIVNVVQYGVNMVLEKKLQKDTNGKQTSFHASSLEIGLNKFQFGIVLDTMTYET
jgi:hypothetical protein